MTVPRGWMVISGVMEEEEDGLEERGGCVLVRARVMRVDKEGSKGSARETWPTRPSEKKVEGRDWGRILVRLWVSWGGREEGRTYAACPIYELVRY